MKILLVNEGSSSNLGDRAIKLAIEDLLRLHGCRHEFYDFSNPKIVLNSCSVVTSHSNVVSRDTLFKKILRVIFPIPLRWLLRNVGTLVRVTRGEFDLLLIGGGQLILSNKIFPMALFCWVLLFKLFNGKRVVIFGVGAGNKFGMLEKKLIKKTLALSDKIYLRDEDSIALVKREFDRVAAFVPDVAYFLSRSNPPLTVRNKVALVGITSYSVYQRYNETGITLDEYLEIWLKKTCQFLDDGYVVKLFYTSPDDIKQTLQLKKKLLETIYQHVELLEIADLDRLILEISSSELLLSGRMHALILGHQFGCDVYPFPISHKIKSYSNEYLQGNKSIDVLQDEILVAFRMVLGCKILELDSGLPEKIDKNWCNSLK